jgi:hypothetical protein
LPLNRSIFIMKLQKFEKKISRTSWETKLKLMNFLLRFFNPDCVYSSTMIKISKSLSTITMLRNDFSTKIHSKAVSISFIRRTSVIQVAPKALNALRIKQNVKCENWFFPFDFIRYAAKRLDCRMILNMKRRAGFTRTLRL